MLSPSWETWCWKDRLEVIRLLKLLFSNCKLASDEDLALGLENTNTDELEQVKGLKNEERKTRGLTLIHDVTSACKNGNKLQSFIGSCVHHHIPIIHASWKLMLTDLK
ncbi:hypothetical protein IC582_026390 [Cucumis melo]